MDLKLIRSFFYNSLNLVLFILCIYCLYNIDIRYGQYDVEPDYLMNALMIDKYGYPTSIFHPGTIHYYLVWAIYRITLFLKLDLISLISLIRLIYLAIGGFFILKYFNKNLSFILGTLSFILFTETFQIGLVSGETLNFFLSILVLNEYLNKKRIFIIGLIFGLMLNIKSSSIILIPIILYFEIINLNKIEYKRILIFIITSSIFYFSYLIISIKSFFYPIKILLIKLFFIEKLTHSSLINFINFSNQKKILIEFSFYFFVLIIGISILFLFVKHKNKFYFLVKKYIQDYLPRLSLIFILLLLVSFLYFDFKSLRFFSSIIIFPFYFVAINFISKNIIFTITTLIMVFFKIGLPVSYDILEVDKEILKKGEISIFMDPGHWVSEIYLIKWMEYIGLGLISIPEHWIKKFNLKNTDSIKLLNVENIDCKDLIELETYPGPVEGLFRKKVSKNCNPSLLKNTPLIIVPREFLKSFNFIFEKNYSNRFELILNEKNFYYSTYIFKTI